MKKRFKILVKLAIWSSIAMYFANKFIESSATINHLLNKDNGNIYNSRHGDIFYTVCGQGSPLILIHDLNPTSSQYEWSSVIKKLAQDHTVYALDLLGCGRSDKPNISYVNYLFVQLLHYFVDDIVGEKADVIATGKSGSFVAMTAKLYPNCIGKITLVNPESFSKQVILPDWKSKTAKAILDCPLLGVTLYYLLTSSNEIEYDFCEKYFYNPFNINRKAIQTYYESAHIQNGDGRHLLASITGNYVNFDIKNAFSVIDNDIHIIFGAENSNAKEISDSYQKINASINCTFIEKTKMLPQLEAPEKFLSCL